LPFATAQDLSEILGQVRQQFPLQNRPARYSLSISHATGMKVNRVSKERER